MTATHPARSVPVRTTLALLLAAAVALGGLLTLVGIGITHVWAYTFLGRDDARIDRDLAAHRTPILNTVTHWITQAAETRTVVVLGAVLALGLLLAVRTWREPAFVAATIGGEVAIFLVVSAVVHRHRPLVPELDRAPPTSSFPSGHTAAATALYGCCAVAVRQLARSRLVRGLLLGMAVLVPAGVAFSRLYRGMHYPTDVLGGAILGASWLAVTTALVLPARLRRGAGSGGPPRR